MIGSENKDDHDPQPNATEYKHFEIMSKQLEEIAEDQLKLARAIEDACTPESSGRPVDALRRTLETVPMPELQLWEPFKADYPTGVAACYLRAIARIMSAGAKAAASEDPARLQHLSAIMRSFAYEVLTLVDEIDQKDI